MTFTENPIGTRLEEKIDVVEPPFQIDRPGRVHTLEHVHERLDVGIAPPYQIDRNGVVLAEIATTAIDGSWAGRIVVGVDGSPSSLDALRRGIRMISSLGGTLEAVLAWLHPNTTADPDPTRDPEHVAAMTLDTSVTAVLEGSRPSWFSQSVQMGATAAVLIERSRGADTLIVGSSRNSGFAGVPHDSVGAACAEHAHCPVLVMHDAERDIVHALAATR